MSNPTENLTSDELINVLNTLSKAKHVDPPSLTPVSDIEPVSNLTPISVEESVSTIEKSIIVNTFVQTLQLILESSDLSKYSVQLNPELIKLLLNVLKSNPEYFNSLESTLLVILNSGKIDISSIPNIIILIKELYQILYNLNVQDIKKGLNISSCELILKFVINVVLEDKIPDQTERTELLTTVNGIIALGVELIAIRKVLKNNKTSLFSCLFTPSKI